MRWPDSKLALLGRVDTASPDDPNEISFSKGEILDIVDKTGKWWQAKRTDGTTGSESKVQLIITSTHAHLLLTVAPSSTFFLYSLYYAIGHFFHSDYLQII